MDLSDAFVRSHELNKYLQLLQVTDLNNPVRHNNTAPFAFRLPEFSTLRDALSMHATLLQVRLSVQGAFVLLTDDTTPYFVAGTPELHSSEEDGLQLESANWLGATDADVQQWLRIFQRTTYRDTKSEDPERVILLLPSMKNDDHACNLSSVCGAPHLSFYAGTPVTSAQGIAIGLVFIVDGSARTYLSRKEKTFLRNTARKCMAQLEFARKNAVQERWKTMNEQLTRFVRSRVSREQELEEPLYLGEKCQQDGEENQMYTLRSLAHRNGQTHPEVQDFATLEGIPDLDSDSEHPLPTRSVSPRRYKENNEHEHRRATAKSYNQSESNDTPAETTYEKVFRKAAERLHKALQADGVLFTDGLLGHHGVVQPIAQGAEELQYENGQSSEKGRPSEEKPQSSTPKHDQNQPGTAQIGSSRTYTSPEFRRGIYVQGPTQIIGMSTHHSELAPKVQESNGTSMQLPKLHVGQNPVITDKYPNGNVWHIHKKTGKSFSSKNGSLAEDKSLDAQRLISVFPGVRQLIFHPMTDPVSLKRLASCFVWTSKSFPVYSDIIELPSLRGFLHTLEAEVARIDAAAAAKQKEVFISSISHELRTPLHGILGSVQLLESTALDAFQKGLAATIKTSSSTLNETLTSVLSYARINQFERQQHKHRQRRPPDSDWSLPNKINLPPGPDTDFESLYKSTDIALLCEELAGVLKAGQTYDESINQQKVAVVVEIDYEENWCYFTEPGALRRIALNVIGNALKYTEEGSIIIKLSAPTVRRPGTKLTEENNERRRVTLNVKDTGKGISKDFIERHMFIPFTQEDTNSKGVGLGMSIVKSLVSLFAGEISVESEPGEGTSVQVIMPMRITKPEQGELGRPTIEMRQTTEFLRKENLSILLYGFPQVVRQALEKHLREWFNCKILEHGENARPDVVLVEEGNDEAMTELQKTSQKYGLHAVLLSFAMASKELAKPLHPMEGYRKFERSSCPIGPNRLGKILSACVDKLQGLRANESEKRQDEDYYKQDVGDKGESGEVSIPNLQNVLSPISPGIIDWGESPSLEKQKVTDMISETPLPIRSKSNAGITSVNNLSPVPSNLDVLVVEDNAINRRLLGAFLDKHGYHNVQFAENGALAVQAVEKRDKQFDVIFMDISMPVMDGFTSTRNIRRIERERSAPTSTSNPFIPAHIVALTGLASERDEDKAHEVGMNKFITKPVQFNKIAILLREQEQKLSSSGPGASES